MRYTEIDLQCEDIMWFGIDNNGCIFMCTTGGCGNVPEFICKSKENVGILEDFFLNELQKSTESVCFTKEKDILFSDALALSEKGVFCFDALIDEKKDGIYSKITVPHKPLRIEDLPINIQEILIENQVAVDVTESAIINVQHAY